MTGAVIQEEDQTRYWSMKFSIFSLSIFCFCGRLSLFFLDRYSMARVGRRCLRLSKKTVFFQRVKLETDRDLSIDDPGRADTASDVGGRKSPFVTGAGFRTSRLDSSAGEQAAVNRPVGGPSPPPDFHRPVAQSVASRGAFASAVVGSSPTRPSMPHLFNGRTWASQA